MSLFRTEPILGQRTEGQVIPEPWQATGLRPAIPIWDLSQQVARETSVKLS